MINKNNKESQDCEAQALCFHPLVQAIMNKLSPPPTGPSLTSLKFEIWDYDCKT